MSFRAFIASGSIWSDLLDLLACYARSGPESPRPITSSAIRYSTVRFIRWGPVVFVFCLTIQSIRIIVQRWGQRCYETLAQCSFNENAIWNREIIRYLSVTSVCTKKPVC